MSNRTSNPSNCGHLRVYHHNWDKYEERQGDCPFCQIARLTGALVETKRQLDDYTSQDYRGAIERLTAEVEKWKGNYQTLLDAWPTGAAIETGMTLTQEDAKVFVEALLNPPAPNEKLRAAVETSVQQGPKHFAWCASLINFVPPMACTCAPENGDGRR